MGTQEEGPSLPLSASLPPCTPCQPESPPQVTGTVRSRMNSQAHVAPHGLVSLTPVHGPPLSTWRPDVVLAAGTCTLNLAEWVRAPWQPSRGCGCFSRSLWRQPSNRVWGRQHAVGSEWTDGESQPPQQSLLENLSQFVLLTFPFLVCTYKGSIWGKPHRSRSQRARARRGR